MPSIMDHRYINAIQINDLPSSTLSYPDAPKYLQLLIEKQFSTEVDKVKLLPESQRAVIALSKPIDLSQSSLDPLEVENGHCPIEALYGKVYESSSSLELIWQNDNITVDQLNLLFSNRNRSRGDRIQSVFIDDNRKRAVITYEAESVVHRVLETHQRCPLALHGETLDIKCLQPALPPLLIRQSLDPYKLIMSGAPNAKKHELETFLIDQSGIAKDINCRCEIIKVKYGYENDVILVEFSTEPDYDTMLRLCRSMPFKGKMVGLQKVPLPTKILVTAEKLPDCEDLDLHFSHQDNGCCGDKCSIHIDQSKQWAVVDFGNPDVAKSVMVRRHDIMGTRVKVDLFYDGFGGYPYNYDTSRGWDEQSKVFVVPVPDPLEDVVMEMGFQGDSSPLAITKEFRLDVCNMKRLKSGLVFNYLVNVFPKLEVSLTDRGLRLHGLPDDVAKAIDYAYNLIFISFSLPVPPLLNLEIVQSSINNILLESKLDAIFGIGDSRILVLCVLVSEADLARNIVKKWSKRVGIELEEDSGRGFPAVMPSTLEKSLPNDGCLGCKESSCDDGVVITPVDDCDKIKTAIDKYKGDSTPHDTYSTSENSVREFDFRSSSSIEGDSSPHDTYSTSENSVREFEFRSSSSIEE